VIGVQMVESVSCRNRNDLSNSFKISLSQLHCRKTDRRRDEGKIVVRTLPLSAHCKEFGTSLHAK
jgi:hypothetical protein